MVDRLDGCQPDWVRAGKSWGAGVSWLCPVHKNHRLILMFANPCDGYDALPESNGKHIRTGSSFTTLTIVQKLELGECFSGFLVDGQFLMQVH